MSQNPLQGWLLSGASGLLGSALNRSLAEAGEARVQLLRRPGSAAARSILWNPAAAEPVTDLTLLEGFQVAVHLSGANIAGHRWTAAYRRELVESRVQTTRALSGLLARLRQPPRVLLVASAVGIYGDRGDEILTEASTAGSGFLAELCHQWEEAADPARAAGIRVVHARLGVLLSGQGGALGKMLLPFQLGLGGPLGSGRQWMSWIAIEDAVRALRFVADTPEVSGAVNVVAPDPVTNREFTRLLAAALHRPAFFPAPAFALKMALGQMAEETLLASQRGNPAVLQAAGFHFRYKNVSEALQAALGDTR